jgi:hypothetical protein
MMYFFGNAERTKDDRAIACLYRNGYVLDNVLEDLVRLL